MKKWISSLALSAALVTSTMSYAGIVANDAEIELAPLQAHTVEVADHTAVVYYVTLDNGDYEIVTTIGPNVGVAGRATQHRIVLSAGQSWSLDIDNGQSTRVISVSAVSDALIVASR